MAISPGAGQRQAQSFACSVVEQVCNVGSGMAIAMVVGAVAYPLLGYSVSTADNFLLTVVFTAISIVRGLVWRRVLVRWFRG